jgi:hypothetical protein
MKLGAMRLVAMRLAVLSGLAVVACSSGLRLPPTGPQPSSAAPLLVDYPPPPARIDKIERDPGEPCVWVDGTYEWIGKHWEWTGGGWVMPRPGCYYRPPALVWAPNAQGPGSLYYFPPKWYEERSNATECAAPKPCTQPVPSQG